MSIRDIILTRRAREQQFEQVHDTFVAKLLAVDYSDSAAVARQPGFVWFQELEPGDPAPGIAFNRKVPALPNLKVTIKRWPKKPFDYEVIDWDPDQIKNLSSYTGTPLLVQHGRDHEPGGYDPINVYSEMMVPLRTDPGGGLTVNVAGYRYTLAGSSVVFGGHNGYSLAAHVPASGLARYVLVYLNTATNALAAVAGATTVDLDTVIPARPDVPTGGIGSAYARLAGGQTEIVRADIKPAREWLRTSGIDQHATNHIRGGSDEIDGDKLDIDYSPSNYSRDTSPAQVDNAEHLTAHLAGIDGALAAAIGGWPLPKKIYLWDVSEEEAIEYASIAAAAAAAASGDAIVCGLGTFSLGTGVTIPLNVDLIGSGKDVSVLATTGGTTAITGGNSTFKDFTLNHLSSVAGRITAMDLSGGCDLDALNVSVYNSDATNSSTAIDMVGGTVNDCDVEAASDGGAGDIGLIASSSVYVYGGYLSAGDSDVDTNTGGVISLRAVRLIHNTINQVIGNGTVNQETADLGFPVINTSGSAVSANDIGYITDAGEFNTLSTADSALMAGNGCVVLVGGANNAEIRVARMGQATVAYTGSAPSQGDLLTSSSSSGDAQAQSYMSAGVFAVATAAGAGGTVEALLLVGRSEIPIFSSNNILRINNADGSDFVATISASGVSGNQVYYNAPSSGNVNAITPNSAFELGHIVLHNTTQGEEALINGVGTDGGGNFIQVTDSDDVSSWVSTDAITTRSQTDTDTVAGFYFFDIEITSTEIPELATEIITSINTWVDSGSTGQRMFLHPYETGSSSKRIKFENALTSGSGATGQVLEMQLTQRRFTVFWESSGSGTATIILRIGGAIIASA